MTQIQPGSIVAAADGSADADQAVRWAAEQAALERRPLVVFTAVRQSPAMVGAWPGPTYVCPADELGAAAQTVADRAMELAVQHRPGLTTQAVAVALDARSALADLTSRVHLLVLGSRGRGQVASKLLGSVSASVIRHAACPVVVCRPGADSRVRTGVLVGADGTDGSLPVLEFAFRHASLRSQPLTVLHSLPDPYDDASVAVFGDRYPEVRFSIEVVRGYAADALATLADRHDLVVIGHRPAEAVTDHLNGATATAVLERSHTNIAVVPEAGAS